MINKEEVFESKTIRKRTPDGTLFVIIDEYPKTGKIAQIRIVIGKSGSGLSAWTFAFSQVVTLALQKGATLEEIITLVSNTNSDRLVYDETMPIRSGPAGFAQALIAYNNDRYNQLEAEIGKNVLRKRGAKLWGRSARRL